MKETESNEFTYTRKDVVVGNRMRSIIIIDKKPGSKIEGKKITNSSVKNVSIKKRKCSGCSRKRKT